MRLDIPIPSFRAYDALHAQLDAATCAECDWCGRPVRAGTAVKRVEREGDELAIVILCPECEFGTD